MVVEGVARTLDPRLDMWSTAEPVVRAWIEQNLGPVGKLQDAAHAFSTLAGFASGLPQSLSDAGRTMRKIEDFADSGFQEALHEMGEMQKSAQRYGHIALWAIAAAAVYYMFRRDSARDALRDRGARPPRGPVSNLAGKSILLIVGGGIAAYNEVERRRAATLLTLERRWIALGPTANWDGKIWPARRFVELARALQAVLPGAGVALFGGPGGDERARAAPVLAGLPMAVDLCGALSLSEAAACLARCALFVGNDSGLMHLAAAAGVPTLGLFGPSPADEYAPVGRCAGFVEADGPAGLAPIAALPVERVLAAATALLERCG